MISRVAGLARDMVIAAVFGASPAADAFFIAFKIPNLFRRLFVEGAFSAAFVPVLTAARMRSSHADVRTLVARVAGTLAALLLLFTAVAIIGAPWLALAFAPGFYHDPVRLELTTSLLRLTFPYLLLISMTALAGGVLNAYQRFGVPALTPVLLNLCLIGAALGFVHLFDVPIMAMGVGVLIAGVLQLLVQLPVVHRLGLLSWPQWAWRDPDVRRVLSLMLPAVFGASVAQLNLLVDAWIASFLTVGSVSWLYYADRLVEFPVGVLAIGLATVTLPLLSRFGAGADPHDFAETLDWSLRVGALFTVPAALALSLLADPLMFTLFAQGAFTAVDARMAGVALQAYSVGLLGFVGVKLLLPGYYARLDTRTPVRIALLCIAVNVVLSLATMRWFGHVGLALSTSAAALLNAFLIYSGLVRAGIYRASALWRRDAIAITTGCAVVAALLLWGVQQIEWSTAALHDRVMCLASLCVAGAVAYGATLFAFGLRPAMLRAPSRL